MSLALAALHPSRISGAAVASGWLPTELWQATDVPIRAVHGRDDRTIDFDRTRAYYTALVSAGADIEATDAPTGHAFGGKLRDDWNAAIAEFVRRVA